MMGLNKYGVTPEHRRTFAPVRSALGLPEKEKYTKPQGKGKSKSKTGWIGE